jgi:hypothetical protein
MVVVHSAENLSGSLGSSRVEAGIRTLNYQYVKRFQQPLRKVQHFVLLKRFMRNKLACCASKLF